MKPDDNAVNAGGFDSFIGMKKTAASETRNAKDLGGTVGRWPTADEIATSLKKTASSADVTRTSTQFVDPAYFDPLLFFIQHRDRKELNFRLRHAYEYEPVVHNLIDLHRTLPLSAYRLSCRDKSIERDMQDFAERMDLLTFSSYILGDYLLLGESIIWKVWDDFNKEWKQLSLIPPEKIEARRTYLTKDPILLLHVDEELKRLANSADPIDQEIVKMMGPKLADDIKTKQRLVLPQHQAFLFANKTSESDLRGVSMLKSALYALMLKYKVRLLHNTYLDRGTFPLKLFKLGDRASKWVPSRSHFEALRNMLMQAANDPSFALIFHYGLEVEYVGEKQHWEDLIKHYAWCDQEIMTSLFANESLLHSKGSTYSNANVSVRLLLSRYQTIRTQVESLWQNQVFRPMAEAREYWVTDSAGHMGNAPCKQKDGKFFYLDVPKFKWEKLNLLDDTAQKQFLMRLRDVGQWPHKQICEMFGFDAEEITQQLKREDGTIIDPAYIESRKKAASNEAVLPQVLQGMKTKEWVMPKQTPEDEMKKKKQQERVDKGNPVQTPPDMGPGAAGVGNAPAGGALKAPGAPSAGGGGLVNNPPGTEVPGGPARPGGAPSGVGKPDESPSGGAGAMTPPI